MDSKMEQHYKHKLEKYKHKLGKYKYMGSGLSSFYCNMSAMIIFAVLAASLSDENPGAKKASRILAIVFGVLFGIEFVAAIIMATAIGLTKEGIEGATS